jgi:hypothetical protein
MIESVRHSLGVLLKDYGGLLTMKWCNSLTCASAVRKRSLLSGWPSYNFLSIALSLLHAHLNGMAAPNLRVTTAECWHELLVSHIQLGFISQ